MIVKAKYSYEKDYFQRSYLEIKVIISLPNKMFPLTEKFRIGFEYYTKNTEEEEQIIAYDKIKTFLTDEITRTKLIKKWVKSMLDEIKYFDKVENMENEIIKLVKDIKKNAKYEVFEFSEKDFETEGDK